ncbi:Astacin-like metalloendopeptidase [Strongyloides ratti]|uniref:Metalloendopeptidase n=1 Tax=Strongyloides ratti TaxID=34506 RepID=A0A090LII6_STRRB|nr:Astacin-like metalloendopeptidase [Strongyloides ratti]CEF69557.1 Astacin-like metalloendopeptidase [Strongyloides ratti]
MMKIYLFFIIIVLKIFYLVQCKLFSKIIEETRELLRENVREIFDQNIKSYNDINNLEQKILELYKNYNTSIKRNLYENNDTVKIMNKDYENNFDFIMDNSMFNPTLFQGDILLTDNQIKKIIDDLNKQILDINREITKTTLTPEVSLTTIQEIITTTIKTTVSTTIIDIESTTNNDILEKNTTTVLTLSPNTKELDNTRTTTTKDDYDYSEENDEEKNIRNKRNLNNTNLEIIKWKLPISYYIDPAINHNNVKQAIKLFHKNTCIRFIKKENYINNTEGINFYPGPGCLSFIGIVKKDNSQDISLGKDCDTHISIIQHQIGHALGLIHQESYSEREYTNKINNLNINKNLSWHLAISNYFNTFDFKFDYDFGSSMHFNDSKLSENGQQTIIPKIIQYNGMKTFNRTFNFNDYKILNYYYCNEKCPIKINKCENNGYQDPNNCLICKCSNPFSGKFCNILSHSVGACGKDILIARHERQALFRKGNSKCIYKILSKKFSKIFLNLTNLQNNSDEPCLEGTGLEIKYRSNKGITGLCLCGTYTNISLYSEDNIVIVKYFGKKLSDYFRLEYTEVT